VSIGVHSWFQSVWSFAGYFREEFKAGLSGVGVDLIGRPRTSIRFPAIGWNRRRVGRLGFRQRVVAGWRTMKTIHLRGPLRVIPLPPQAQPCIRVFAFYDSLFKKSNTDRSRFFQFFADFLFSHTPNPSPSGLACGSALSIYGHQFPLAGWTGDRWILQQLGVK